MKAYSKDLRLRVLAAVDWGMPRAQVAKTFGVSVSTIKRYRRCAAQADPRASRAQTGAPGEELPAQVRLNPDLTLEEHSELFEETHGVEVSSATVSRALKRLGVPLKKDPRFLRA
jgi:transposase